MVSTSAAKIPIHLHIFKTSSRVNDTLNNSDSRRKSPIKTINYVRPINISVYSNATSFFHYNIVNHGRKRAINISSNHVLTRERR